MYVRWGSHEFPRSATTSYGLPGKYGLVSCPQNAIHDRDIRPRPVLAALDLRWFVAHSSVIYASVKRARTTVMMLVFEDERSN